ncbi:hypothetical protein J5288_27110, partial [Agrobacterium sp. S2/73]|nr:hypothetical protein [Agrobacterium sp. S2/73]
NCRVGRSRASGCPRTHKIAVSASTRRGPRTALTLERQHNDLVSALRSVLYEFGHPVPRGIGHLNRIEAMVEAENSDLPELVRDECRDILLQIAERTQLARLLNGE